MGMDNAVIVSSLMVADLYSSLSNDSAKWYEQYDIRYTLDERHNGNGYYAYLWPTDDGKIAGTPIVYTDDQIEVGKLSGFLGIHFSDGIAIPLANESYIFSESNDFLNGYLN